MGPQRAFTSRGALGYNAAMQRRFSHYPALEIPKLADLYTRTLALYLVLMYVLWAIGLEGIYGHPTPFYALYAPSTGTPLAVALAILGLFAGYWALTRPDPLRPAAWRGFVGACGVLVAVGLALEFLDARDAGESLRAHAWDLLPRLAWQLPALAVFAAGAALFVRSILPHLVSSEGPDRRETKRILWMLFGFSIAFACAIAMIRGGLHGIEQAYQREAYEYVGDIGKTRNIRALFSQYLDIHEHLSMHAKVHPPGPIALLWLFSTVMLSRSALALSLATVVFGSLAIFPLYGWAKRVTCQRTAIIACLCYVVVPSVVLFTATSADVLFAPFTLATLYCFERAIRTRSVSFALAAGAGYGAMMLLKFSLIGIGAYFGLVGLWMLRKPETRLHVVQTAVLMVAGVAAVLGAIYLWSGYNIYENFFVAKAQFHTDQYHLDELTPRLPAWTYQILNPAAWFYFAGIPVSLLYIREFLSSERGDRSTWIVFILTLVALNLLYLARGEGERSALYLIPFLLIPAASQLQRMMARQDHHGPLAVTLAFLAFQTWFTETFFYTYW